MNTIAEYGPFDLRNCTAGELSFDIWYLIDGTDQLDVLISDGSGWDTYPPYRYKGDSDGWQHIVIDFSDWLGNNLLGNKEVGIAFRFRSDAAWTSKGAFIDNVKIRKNFSGWSDLTVAELGFSPRSINYCWGYHYKQCSKSCRRE